MNIHSFKVGRVGDEEIFVKLQVNVSHVAWLLKPKLGDSLEVQCHCRHLKIKFFHCCHVDGRCPRTLGCGTSQASHVARRPWHRNGIGLGLLLHVLWGGHTSSADYLAHFVVASGTFVQ